MARKSALRIGAERNSHDLVGRSTRRNRKRKFGHVPWSGVAESIRQGIKAGIKGRLGSSLVEDRGSPPF